MSKWLPTKSDADELKSVVSSTDTDDLNIESCSFEMGISRQSQPSFNSRPDGFGVDREEAAGQKRRAVASASAHLDH